VPIEFIIGWNDVVSNQHGKGEISCLSVPVPVHCTVHFPKQTLYLYLQEMIYRSGNVQDSLAVLQLYYTFRPMLSIIYVLFL